MSENLGNVSGELTLDSLLMRTGPLADVLKEDMTWPEIASKLKEVFFHGDYFQSLPGEDQATYVAELCTVYYVHGKGAVTKELDDAKYTDQIPAVADFLEEFMKANGQWGYIGKQDWFTSGEHAIAIDVNYYPDRSGFKEFPIFHKDTGGNNIFVNLIFDNEKEIEATEWFADTKQPSTKRAEWQKKLLPQSHLDELDRLRIALRQRFGETDEVSGGISTGKYTYVSWVDDLIWHSTPSTSKRVEYTAAAALASYQGLDSTLEDDFECFDQELKVKILGVEILGTIAECTETHLHNWLNENKLTAQDISFDRSKEAWKALYRGNDGHARYSKDAEERAKSPWRITGEYSEATAKDSRLEGSSSIEETPVGLSQRRRADSLDKNREALEKVRVANVGVPRSFLRTWVRILPMNSSELNDVDLNLQ